MTINKKSLLPGPWTLVFLIAGFLFLTAIEWVWKLFIN